MDDPLLTSRINHFDSYRSKHPFLVLFSCGNLNDNLRVVLQQTISSSFSFKIDPKQTIRPEMSSNALNVNILDILDGQICEETEVNV